ncbi:hypothetical protein Zm00014a_037050 [Zea mays]|nr:hypothetical protein Zm00014a_037050 [Zea mays]
MSALGKT